MTNIYENYSAFLSRENSDDNGVSAEFAAANPNYAAGFRNARPVESMEAADNPLANIPVIPNIHQALLAAVTAPEHALKMDNWHSCGMTHCRSGWVITLAGEAGRKLEQLTTSEFAAMQIYKASSPIRVSPVRFYETNEVAMADIVKCAAEEAALQPA